MRTTRIASLSLVLLAACTPRPSLVLGNECELTTQCASPLVCRLGACREECRANRDCRAGLVCLRTPDGLGACELPDVDSCTLTSQCHGSLVCLMGRCSEPCMTDRDCPAGAVCATDGAGNPIGCRDMSMTECEYNSDCVAPLICAPDHRCREQCHTDRDCRDGEVCDHTTTPTVCGPPRDAGMPSDGGGMDAGPIDAAMDDASADAGTDTGIDANVDAAVAMTGPAPIPLLAAGSDHVCATRASDGELRCWGNDMNGQIGDGTSGTNRTVATLVTPSLGTVTMLATGALHSCAYSTTTGLSCWGDGTSGQIGDNMIVSHSSPTAVMGSVVPTWIAAGHGHTCAVVSGAVRCWGDNTSGQLGTGDTSVHHTPAATLALAATAIQVEARSNTTCALLSDGRVQCWGDGTGDQLGTDISPSLYSATPLLVPGIADAVDVAVGSAHACARSTSGIVSCWGRDSFGQLGDGLTSGMRATPAPTTTMPPAVEIGAAANQTCARTIDGDVYCWGDNFLGQGGMDGFTTPTLRNPTRVAGVSGALEIAVGDNHACARVAAGIVCWGDDAAGELGNGPAGSSFTPGPVTWL